MPRAKASGFSTGPPTFPSSLVEYIKVHDPSSILNDPSSLVDPSQNPFFGKHVLVLSGADDKLVPWSASKRFVDELQVGPGGTKKVIVEEGAGHECTPQMVRELARFVWEHALQPVVESAKAHY